MTAASELNFMLALDLSQDLKDAVTTGGILKWFICDYFRTAENIVRINLIFAI